jgi:hypothetical protein
VAGWEGTCKGDSLASEVDTVLWPVGCMVQLPLEGPKTFEWGPVVLAGETQTRDEPAAVDLRSVGALDIPTPSN